MIVIVLEKLCIITIAVKRQKRYNDHFTVLLRAIDMETISKQRLFDK